MDNPYSPFVDLVTRIKDRRWRTNKEAFDSSVLFRLKLRLVLSRMWGNSPLNYDWWVSTSLLGKRPALRSLIILKSKLLQPLKTATSSKAFVPHLRWKQTSVSQFFIWRYLLPFACSLQNHVSHRFMNSRTLGTRLLRLVKLRISKHLSQCPVQQQMQISAI